MPKQGISAVLMPEPILTPVPQDNAEPFLADQHDGTNQHDQEAEHEELAVLAYQLWVERGCPEGSPEEDWYRAVRERQLRSFVPQT
jgi:hypothetical protein